MNLLRSHPGLSVPDTIMQQLEQYARTGECPTPFLFAVLSNNLCNAVNNADADACAALPDIVRYVSDTLPAFCFGTPEKVNAFADDEKAHSSLVAFLEQQCALPSLAEQAAAQGFEIRKLDDVSYPPDAVGAFKDGQMHAAFWGADAQIGVQPGGAH